MVDRSPASPLTAIRICVWEKLMKPLSQRKNDVVPNRTNPMGNPVKTHGRVWGP